ATCPTLAAACLVARSAGRLVSRNGSMPAAIAPDDTITTSEPAFILASIASANTASLLASKTPDEVVNAVVPTLMTTLRAVRTASRCGLVTTHRRDGGARAGRPYARRLRPCPSVPGAYRCRGRT